jgi:hypothetical protein
MDEQIEQIIPERKKITLSDISILKNEGFPLKIFDEKVISFFNAISKTIMKDRKINQIPSLVALGYWLRKGNIETIIKENDFLISHKKYKATPIGIVFHICPSNVDTMFLYSLAISLLAGNKNILRISSKINNTEINALFDIITNVMNNPEFEIFKHYICIVNYEHIDSINMEFSLRANARIIWGGDATVELFKSFKTHSKTKDIVFPDRISYAVFKAKEFETIDEKMKGEIVKKFFNDSYTFDQRGCSSAQIVFIYGESADIKIFEKEFYSRLKDYADKFYTTDIYSLSSLKYNHLVSDVIENKGSVNDILHEDNLLYFTEISEPEMNLVSCGGGYFYIKNIQNIESISSFISPKVQTISYFGLNKEEIERLFEVSAGKGIDRIVPIGEALSFDYIWDGYNILAELCSIKTVK